ncbi:MAG: radical SAM protein, partial [Firmicutes bacterium]|nr:radical SAM protein [Bacillota bacterium]
KILELLSHTNTHIEILSKSDLMVKDIDLLKKMPDLSVGISLNTLDDDFRKSIEPGAPSISRRLNALKTLHSEGIRTYLFISPIFPHITKIQDIIEAAADSIDRVCFENLNLRGSAKHEMLCYIAEKYPQYLVSYKAIYLNKDTAYWKQLETEIDSLSAQYPIPFINYFYHAQIKKGGKKND